MYQGTVIGLLMQRSTAAPMPPVVALDLVLNQSTGQEEKLVFCVDGHDLPATFQEAGIS
ncbi:hypothetical protein J6590_046789 [Homalodisca vitripennis]|nr:hypothetical protein J6590_046789 [Homalodisca vitripennis]